MDTSRYTIPYVAGWASSVKDTEPAEVIKATGERVRKTALGILDQLDTFQIANGTPPGLTRELSERVAPGTDAGRERPTVPSVPVVEPEIEPVTVLAGRGL
jgi:hypothetical protein